MDAAQQSTLLRVKNLRVPAAETVALPALVAAHLGLPVAAIEHLDIARQAIDARQARIDWVYTLVVRVVVGERALAQLLTRSDCERYTPPAPVAFAPLRRSALRPIVIGCGPAGLLTAWGLLQRGLTPLVLERGGRVTERAAAVAAFWRGGGLDPDTNVLFGEGGAGTFSDGKLTTRTKSPLRREVFELLIAAGADTAISYAARPHLGTDALCRIIPRIVARLIERGAEVRFHSRVTGFAVADGRVRGVRVGAEVIPADTVFVATGHSADDMYALLGDCGVQLEARPFAAGVRVEHPREFIDRVRYGRHAGSPHLGAADYTLTYRDGPTGRGVYSFCMCPGGRVIGCAAQPDALCTNGMSTAARDAPWSNAALVVTVRPADFSDPTPLGGVAWQRALEQACYRAGGGTGAAPAQDATSFCAAAAAGRPLPAASFRPAVVACDLRGVLPDILHAPLERALQAFDRQMPGFIAHGLLIGCETRTAAPVRMVRDPRSGEARGLRGIFPVGEGAGYAGGIVSSAVDGLRAALSFA